MSKVTVIKDLVSNPRKLLFYIVQKSCPGCLSDDRYLKMLYFARFGKKLNLNNPQSFNEKIQWLKLNDRNPEYVIDVDKYTVREKITKLFPNQDLLVPLLGVYNSVEDINFKDLPHSFVLKCTHGTHCSIICKDKSMLDVNETKRILRGWMKKNYFSDAREWPYKTVIPRIICEPFIQDSHGELVDYKFMCFDGKVKMILVHQDINNTKGQHTLDLYTPNWEKTDIEWGVPNSEWSLPKPEQLEECISISEALAANRRHVRVDLYIVDKKVYFGELTYYTAAGFKPFKRYSDDLMLGGWIHL